ncbi:hypothetical protein GCM10009096_34240 [Parasphingorhabdus litoris]|uniref:HNH endonuclease n=1 Tax=Parasphingorhabdus litoris TaxID=394733 RepID=A0ABP3KY67_9SPHN|nr:AHH domain-containing protein [Parasphingorhabdus litoris]
MTRFSKINRKNADGYNPHYQRHHLIPLQAGSIDDVAVPLHREMEGGFDFDDFDKNGILLPSNERVALQTGRPLHRGPHPRYNELVIDRLLLIIKLSEQIESLFQRQSFFRFRVSLLQFTLRRALLGRNMATLRLNKRDPGVTSEAFRDLDDCVDILCVQTQWPPVK